jgi:heme-degrading monooxygenase HmoA
VSGSVIARTWRGWVRTEDRAAYVDYIERTGMAEYRSTPGNQGAWMLARDLPDGRTEIVTLSFWATAEAIRGFAGEDIGRAVFYPEDDRYLVDRETTVTHYEVVA